MGLVALPFLARAVIAKRAHPEETDHVLQGFGLRREFFRRTGELFCARGVSLRDQADLADRPVDLAHASGLLSGRSGDFLHQVRGLLNRRDQFGQQSARALCDLYVGGSQTADFLSRSTAALREIAHFASDYGKPAAM